MCFVVLFVIIFDKFIVFGLLENRWRRKCVLENDLCYDRSCYKIMLVFRDFFKLLGYFWEKYLDLRIIFEVFLVFLRWFLVIR